MLLFCHHRYDDMYENGFPVGSGYRFPISLIKQVTKIFVPTLVLLRLVARVGRPGRRSVRVRVGFLDKIKPSIVRVRIGAGF